MPAVHNRIGCTVCGMARAPRFFGIDAKTGAYDPDAKPPRTVLYRFTFAGKSAISSEQLPMPLHLAQGLRSALRASLALVEREILEAGGTLDDE